MGLDVGWVVCGVVGEGVGLAVGLLVGGTVEGDCPTSHTSTTAQFEPKNFRQHASTVSRRKLAAFSGVFHEGE